LLPLWVQSILCLNPQHLPFYPTIPSPLKYESYSRQPGHLSNVFCLRSETLRPHFSMSLPFSVDMY
jgi:hypothetical protein